MELPVCEVEPLRDLPQVTEHELARGNRWLIGLRWLVAGGIVAAALVAAGPLHYPVPVVALVSLGAVVAGYNGILHIVERRLARRYSSALAPAMLLANAQIALDLVALAVLVHLAGGITNPFAVYFVFHMIIASYLLTPLAAYAQAALASALYAGVVGGEQTGLLHHVSVFAGREPRYTGPDAAGHTAVLASALFITVFLTTAITRKLRQRERDLAAALEEVQDQAQTCEIARADLLQTQELQLRYMRRVSHELRGPLASLALGLRVIRDGLAGDVPEKVRELIVRAEARSETLLDLVDDLLTLSRVQDAPLPEPMQQVTADALVNDVVESLADSAAARAVAVIARVAPGLPTFAAQPDGLRTALLNLVGNAIKYTPRDGRVEVNVTAGGDPPQIVFRVSDTGMGISREELPRLFEEFFRTESARQSQIHGTGLGLAIVKLIVEAHHGSIAVTSTVGEGSVFTLSLPIAGVPPAEGDGS